MMNLTEQGNFIKIGARELSKDQAEILLPTYQSIIKQVEKFRKNAASTDRNYDEYKLIGTKSALEENYSNSISILGTRGSGKTSILLTLKKHFGKDTVSNITLPMIIPEFIGKSNDTLGWILGYLEDEIKKLEKLDKEASFYRGESNKYNERMSLKYPQERITEEFNKLCQTYFLEKKL
ncbi:hypothetical protein Q5O89_20865 [Peribacillus frigoritolerans]|nr:hypothetical protein [Peribacillus frigoritolerans]